MKTKLLTLAVNCLLPPSFSLWAALALAVWQGDLEQSRQRVGVGEQQSHYQQRELVLQGKKKAMHEVCSDWADCGEKQCTKTPSRAQQPIRTQGRLKQVCILMHETCRQRDQITAFAVPAALTIPLFLCYRHVIHGFGAEHSHMTTLYFTACG